MTTASINEVNIAVVYLINTVILYEDHKLKVKKLSKINLSVHIFQNVYLVQFSIQYFQ